MCFLASNQSVNSIKISVLMTKSKKKLILITGATSGIGLALVKRLHTDHNLILVGRKNLQETELQNIDNIKYIQCDISNPTNAVKEISDSLKALGVSELNHVVQCAGVGQYEAPASESIDNIFKNVSVNLLFPVLLIRELVPLLGKANGRATILGSVAHKGSGNMASYSATKAGVNGLVRSLSSEWQERISVQVIHPGPTSTSMHEKAGYTPGLERLLFVRPDVMADEIAQIIETDKVFATVFLKAKFKSLFRRRKAA